jgi:hypothetical protein
VTTEINIDDSTGNIKWEKVTQPNGAYVTYFYGSDNSTITKER